MGFNDVPTEELIKRTAEELKKIEAIRAPEWAQFVKTGAHKECPPVDPDWWYMRTASVLRKIAILGPVGVSKLRRKYGGVKNRGHKPERFYKGSGNIIRKALQQLEKAELATKAEKGVHKGRVIAPKGHALLDKVASGLMKELNIILPKKPEQKFAVKKKVKKTKKKASKSKAKTGDKSTKETKVKKPRKKRVSKKKVVKKTEANAEAKPVEAKVETKTEAKPVEAKTEAKPETKTEAKPVEAKVETKTEAKPETKTEAKPVEAKTETKTEAKPETKAEVKTEEKSVETKE